jgi:hypothetical protein
MVMVLLGRADRLASVDKRRKFTRRHLGSPNAYVMAYQTHQDSPLQPYEHMYEHGGKARTTYWDIRWRSASDKNVWHGQQITRNKQVNLIVGHQKDDYVEAYVQGRAIKRTIAAGKWCTGSRPSGQPKSIAKRRTMAQTGVSRSWTKIFVKCFIFMIRHGLYKDERYTHTIPNKRSQSHIIKLKPFIHKSQSWYIFGWDA